MSANRKSTSAWPGAIRMIPAIIILLAVACMGIMQWADRRAREPLVRLVLGEKETALLERAKRENGDEAVRINGLRLDLTAMQLQDEDFVGLVGIHNLRSLDLSKSNIKDAKLVLLTSLNLLEDLNLSYTDVSDAGMETLKKMRRLRSLDVTRTKVTAACIRDLRVAMPGIKATRFGSDFEFGGNAVYPSLGKLVLVQYGGDRAAFKLTEITNRGDGGAKYVWYYWQRDMRGKFVGVPSRQGEGEVFEKYRVVEQKPDATLIEDDGGELSLVLGPIKLMWSQPRIVYFPGQWGDPSPTKMALTPWEKLEEINFDSKLLKWYEQEEL